MKPRFLLVWVLTSGCMVQTESVEGGQGPTGDTGPKGDPGKQGDPGLPGASPFSYVSTSESDIYYDEGKLGIGTSEPSSLLHVGHFSGDGVSSADTKITVEGKNLLNTADGLYYGSYGQLLFRANANLTAEARSFLLTNALQGTKFAIVRSADAVTEPAIIGHTGNTVSGGTADLVIDNSGNVGLGTSVPEERLDLSSDAIYGYVNASGIRLGNSNAPSVNVGASHSYTIRTSGSPSGVRLDVVTRSREDAGSSDTTTLSLRNNNVGIGTTTPVATLDVNGTARLTKYSQPPFTCDLEHDGTLALTSKYSLCVCHGLLADWRNTATPETSGCPW